MRALVGIAFAALLIAAGCAQQPDSAGAPAPEVPAEGGTEDMKPDISKLLTWYGHATLMLKAGDKSIYWIDPYNFKGGGKEKADIVFITHAHYDHCSWEDLRQVLKEDTLVVSPQGCVEKFNLSRTLIVEPNRDYEAKGVSFSTVPAYNTKKERLSFHPKENLWVGYVLSVDGLRVCHAGDTDFIEEMRRLGKIDVALLPIGGTYTMDVEEAVESANAINATITIPIHYRALLKGGAGAAEEKFMKGVRGKVTILQEYS